MYTVLCLFRHRLAVLCFAMPLFRTCLLAALIFLAGCAPEKDTATLSAEAGVLIMNNAAEPAGLDPQVVTGMLESRIVSALFEGLVAYDPKTL